MRRGHQINRATNSWNTAWRYTYHSQSICQPPARWFTPNAMDHRVWPSTQAFQILKLPRIGAVQAHSGDPGTNQPLTPQPTSWKETLQDLADTEPIHTNIQLVGPLTISQNQTIFEISIRTTSIGNFRSGSCSPSPNLHSKARQAGDFHTDSDTVLGFFQILVRQLSREETIEVIETKGAMVSSETI